MNEAVLDASALLAVMLGEAGQDVVAAALPGALLSAVNLAEVVAKLAERGVPTQRAHAAALSLGVVIVALDEEVAVAAGALRGSTREAGLSLGDRCCLALAIGRGLPVLTADEAWASVADRIGATVRLIRRRSA